MNCKNCGEEFASIDNNWNRKTYLNEDFIETYNHKKIKFEYCSNCGTIHNLIKVVIED